MLQRTETASGSLVIEGARIDLIERGKGRPVLFLHAENGIEPAAAAIVELAKSARVIAPTHPGFGRSELPKGMHTRPATLPMSSRLPKRNTSRSPIVIRMPRGAITNRCRRPRSWLRRAPAKPPRGLRGARISTIHG